MKITGLDHITVNVTDLEASKAFYENIIIIFSDFIIFMIIDYITYSLNISDIRFIFHNFFYLIIIIKIINTIIIFFIIIRI